MINKKLLIIFVLALILIVSLMPIYKKITGWLVNTTAIVSVSSGSYADVCIYAIEPPPDFIKKGSPLTIKGEVLNCGSNTMDITVEIGIRDSEDHFMLLSNITNFYDVNPSERKNFDFMWITQGPIDKDTLTIRTYFANQSRDVNFTFILQKEETPEPPQPGAGPSAGGGGSGATPNFIIDFNRKINLTPDITQTFLVKIINNGDFDLHNLTLTLQSKYIKTRIVYPEGIDVLPKNQSILFTTELTPLSSITSGDHLVDIIVRADELTKNDVLVARVEQLPMREKLKDLIFYYEQLIEKMDEEIQNASEDNRNVTLAQQLLEEAKSDLSVAKDYYKIGLYQETLEQLDKVRKRIDDIIVALAKAEKIKIIVAKLPSIPFNYIFIILLIMITSVVLFFIIKRRKEEKELPYIKRWSF